MGEISSTGFKYLSLHKKLEIELEKNIKKIDRQVMRRRQSLFVETENARRDVHEMFKAAQDIDNIFGPEFTDNVAKKVFPSKRQRSIHSNEDDGVVKTTSYILTQARNAMKELKKRKKREKMQQNRRNHIRKKTFTKRLSKVEQDNDKDLKMMLDSIQNLTLLGNNSDKGHISLPQIKVSDSEEGQNDTGDKQPRLGASKSKLSSQRWKDLKMIREFSLPVINKDTVNSAPRCTMNDDVEKEPNERHSAKERPKMPPRNSFDLSTLPAISLAKQTIELPPKSAQTEDNRKCKDSEQKDSSFTISKYLSEVHENLPKETLLEIERMMKEESFFF